MIEIRRMSECTWKEAVGVWNEGFQDYFADVKMDADTFTARLAREGLSPDLSIVAFHDGRPVGILLNGIRSIAGKRMAWNGGTAVVPRRRRSGVGKALLEAAIRIYRENGGRSPPWSRFVRTKKRSLCTGRWDTRRSTGFGFIDVLQPFGGIPFRVAKVTPSEGGSRRMSVGSPFTEG